jgi:hypothetical protein
MTGSTNWTETELCTQSNNCIIVEDDGIANDYFAYWNRLKNDKQPARKPVTVTVKAGKKVKGAGIIKLPPPAIWWPAGDQSKVAMIRAAAVRVPFGNLRPELLTAGHAIIHDKIIVIDPLDEKKCTVITGSHNLGYKASYCNDENLLIHRRKPRARDFLCCTCDRSL